jgi:hypothetical protein
MKKLVFFLSLFAALNAVAARPPEVSEKVLKAFNETFVKAIDVVWHESQNIYEAHFKQSEIVTRATYDRNGNLLRTTRYYSEENLPINVLTKLKKRYEGKSVYGVTESTTEDEVAYYITLQDEKNWYIVKADNWGSLELTQKFRKA